MKRWLSARGSQWDTLQHSVFVNSTFKLQTTSDELVLPTGFSWTELSPTSYEADLESNGAFILVLMESYDPNWKASVNGERISENNHFEVNGYANEWLVNATNETRVEIDYETQNLFTESVAASAILPGLLVAFLFRNDLRNHLQMAVFRFPSLCGRFLFLSFVLFSAGLLTRPLHNTLVTCRMVPVGSARCQ